MKIRFGFVSNSSSSSYLIYGCSLDEDVVRKIINSKKHGYALGEELQAFIKDSFLCVDHPSDPYNFCVGLSWDSIGDNETGSQFKEKIAKEVKRLFGDDMVCSTHQDAWFDG